MKNAGVLFITFVGLSVLTLLGASGVHAQGLQGHYGVPANTVDCEICHDFAGGYYACNASGCHDGVSHTYREEGVQPEPHTPGAINLRWVRTSIQWPKDTGPVYSPVKFTTFAGSDGSLADGNDSKLDGPCEVCHPPYDAGPPETGTKYHNNAGDGKDHYDGTNCTGCHPHFANEMLNYFEPRFIGTQAHTTHFTDPKGPRLQVLTAPDGLCPVCHQSNSVFNIFADDQPIETTTVCDRCHSPGGNYDGVGEKCEEGMGTWPACESDPDYPKWVSYGAKFNWENGIYEETGDDLKAGKELWCAGCHDDESAYSRSSYQPAGPEARAPNVMGDSAKTYGFVIPNSGHGRNPSNPVYCKDCHNVSGVYDDPDQQRIVNHIDHVQRTYVYPGTLYPTYDYRNGYRLTEYMPVPRSGQTGQTAFKVCYSGCHHVYTDQFSTGIDTHFRDDYKNQNWHDRHVGSLLSHEIVWDSDWDGEEDSAMSCTACHNVHGSPFNVGGTLEPNPVMIRHGELISTYGTTDKVPALDFHWYKYNGTPVALLDDSRIGGTRSIGGHDISFNHVCWGACHTNPPEGGEITYTRNPGDVAILDLWTTDLSNNKKTQFARGEDIRYHVLFRVFGSGSYFDKTFLSSAYNTSGAAWETPLTRSQTCTYGTYEWAWNKTIPMAATPGSNAQIKMVIKNFEFQGGPEIGKHVMYKNFTIAP